MTTHETRTVLIHGELGSRSDLLAALPRHGYRVVLAPDLPALSAAHEADCVLTSLRGGDRIADLAALKACLPIGPVLVVVPADCPRTTRAAFRAGAFDCLCDPPTVEELVARIGETVHARANGRKAAPAIGAHGLPEHGAFLAALVEARQKCQDQRVGMSLVLIDLDRFAECNAVHSPAQADRVLRWLAQIVRRASRKTDLVGHFESDCMVVAMPRLRAAAAVEFVSACRDIMQESPPILSGRPHPMTVSAGIAECSPGFPETEHQLLQRARLAMEQAKRDGGCRTVTWSELLDNHVNRPQFRGLTLDGASRMVQRLRLHVEATHSESTQALVAAVEARDPYTQAHSLTVAAYAEAIARRMRLSPRMIRTVRSAALLHDVGKIGVPDRILTKPGKLTSDEIDIVRQHPQKAIEILEHVSYLTDEKPIILHHHERFDGNGYPAGLAGDRIPIGARIVAVADALDTMLSPRTYKKAYPLDRVREELTANAGGQFDPAVIEATLAWLDEEPAFATDHAPEAATPDAH